MTMRIVAFAAALVVGFSGQSLAFDPSAEYSVHSLSQPEGQSPIRALGVPGQTGAIGDRLVMDARVGFAIDPSAEYGTSTAWQPKGLAN